MKSFGILVAAVLALSGQTPAPQAPAHHVLHLVYRFGYNTDATNSGQGTGTTTIDVKGTAPDGGVMISGTDFWWNTVRARATNTCELYKDGTVACNQAPYALSPIQLSIFPLLAKDYFKNVAGGPSKWSHTYTVAAAVVPGATGFAGQKYTWNCSFNFHNEGPIKGSTPPLDLVTMNGTLVQGFFRAASKGKIAYDPAHKVPAVVSERRTHIPQRSSESFDVINLKLQQIQRS